MTLQSQIKKMNKRRKVAGFNPWGMRRATPADVRRLWARLWGDVPHIYVKAQWDNAQHHGMELMDLCEGLHVNQPRVTAGE